MPAADRAKRQPFIQTNEEALGAIITRRAGGPVRGVHFPLAGLLALPAAVLAASQRLPPSSPRLSDVRAAPQPPFRKDTREPLWFVPDRVRSIINDYTRAHTATRAPGPPKQAPAGFHLAAAIATHELIALHIYQDINELPIEGRGYLAFLRAPRRPTQGPPPALQLLGLRDYTDTTITARTLQTSLATELFHLFKQTPRALGWSPLKEGASRDDLQLLVPALDDLVGAEVFRGRLCYRRYPRPTGGRTHYLCLDLLVSLGSARPLHRVAIDLDRGKLRSAAAMTAGEAEVEASLWDLDPISATGDTGFSRDDYVKLDTAPRIVGTLTGLDSPAEGSQVLSGSHVRVVDGPSDDEVRLDHPQQAHSSTPFADEASAKHFFQCNAYFHMNRALDRTARLCGMTVDQFFDGSDFALPLLVTLDTEAEFSHIFADARAARVRIKFGPRLNGDAVLNEDANRAADPRAHWHELSHFILLHYLEDTHLPFAHSVGDSLAVLFCDPLLSDEALTNDDIRYAYAPFSQIQRRHDQEKDWYSRMVSDLHRRKHKLEEILTTCHFRLYLALGGGARARRGDRSLAAEQVMRMILMAVRSAGRMLREGVDADNSDVDAVLPTVESWCSICELVDASHTDVLLGGFAQKVIRWAFCAQGNFPARSAADVSFFDPITEPKDLYRYSETPWLRGIDEDEAVEGVDWLNPGEPSGAAPLFVRAYVAGETEATARVCVYRSEPVVGLQWPSSGALQSAFPGQTVGGLTAVATSEDRVIAPGECALFGFIPPAAGGFLYVVAYSAADEPLLCEGAPVPVVFPRDNNLACRCLLDIAYEPGEADEIQVSFSLRNYTQMTLNPCVDFSVELASAKGAEPGGVDLSAWTAKDTLGDHPGELSQGDQVNVTLSISPPSGLKLAETVELAVIVSLRVTEPGPDGIIPGGGEPFTYGGFSVRLHPVVGDA